MFGGNLTTLTEYRKNGNFFDIIDICGKKVVTIITETSILAPGGVVKIATTTYNFENDKLVSINYH